MNRFRSQVKGNTEHIGDYDALQLRNIVVRYQPSSMPRYSRHFSQGFFIFIGVIWLLTSIIVIYGVRKRSQAAMCCFVVTLLLMFIVEIAVGIAAAVVLKVRSPHVQLPATSAHIRPRKKPQTYQLSSSTSTPL